MNDTIKSFTAPAAAPSLSAICSIICSFGGAPCEAAPLQEDWDEGLRRD